MNKEDMLVGIAGGIVIAQIIESMMRTYDTRIFPADYNCTVMICAYNEQDYIKHACHSIANQNIVKKFPKNFQILLVDSESTDRTVEYARPYVDDVISAPRGKLNARNFASDYATGDIIVAADGDSYHPDGWLNTLINGLREPGVIGVKGATIDHTIPLIPAAMYNYCQFADHVLLNPNKMSGGNCAYYKKDFFKVGGFNPNIDQNDINQMINEEEISFGNRLARYGKIRFLWNAGRIHWGGRKLGCRLGTELDKQKCNNAGIGETRF